MMPVAYASSRLIAIVFPDITFFFPSQACQAPNYYIYYDYDKSLTMFLSIYCDYDQYNLVFHLFSNVFIKDIIFLLSSFYDPIKGRSSHRDRFYNISVLQMQSKSFKDTVEGIHFIVKLPALDLRF